MDEHTKLDRHREVNIKYDDRLQKDGKKVLNFNEECEEQKEEFMELMSKLTDMCNGRLGTVKKVEHRIYFDPDNSLPIIYVPYLAGIKDLEQ